MYVCYLDTTSEFADTVYAHVDSYRVNKNMGILKLSSGQGIILNDLDFCEFVERQFRDHSTKCINLLHIPLTDYEIVEIDTL